MPTSSELEDWKAEMDANDLELGPSLLAHEEINAPASRAWQVISEPGNLKDCHPFCANTEVEKWPGLGSRDSITYYSGIHYHRNFVNWLEGTGYDIELGDSPNQTARVLWRIDPKSEDMCQISIEAFPFVRKSLDQEKKKKYLDRLFGDVLQHYLECVCKGICFFSETNTPVTKDQFGKNPLYSDST